MVLYRQMVEATTWRMKPLHGIGRHRLAGTINDRQSVPLTAAGNCFRIWLRLLCAHWESTTESFILATWALRPGLCP